MFTKKVTCFLNNIIMLFHKIVCKISMGTYYCGRNVSSQNRYSCSTIFIIELKLLTLTKLSQWPTQWTRYTRYVPLYIAEKLASFFFSCPYILLFLHLNLNYNLIIATTKNVLWPQQLKGKSQRHFEYERKYIYFEKHLVITLYIIFKTWAPSFLRTYTE